MELIWVCWFIFGMIMGALVGLLVERESNGNSDNTSDPDVTAGQCDGMDRPDPTPEEISNVLYLFRIGASNREKRVLDYLIDKEGEDDEAY